MGYRGFHARKEAPAYPFGYGLSYTEYRYRDLWAEPDATGGAVCGVRVRNAGERAGKETVLVFVAKPHTGIARAKRELRAFAKVPLEPGEERDLRFELPNRAFCHYEPERHRFEAEGGPYRIEICADADHVLLSCEVEIARTPLKGLRLHRNISIREAMRYEGGERVMRRLVEDLRRLSGINFDPFELTADLAREVNMTHPLRALLYNYRGKISDEQLEERIRFYNREVSDGEEK